MAVRKAPDAEWDVFLSYSRAEARKARALASALQGRGLRVFVDDSAVDDFTSITAAITQALTRSKALLALYSADYPRRRACQWELTYAYLAGQREGDPRQRILVINPEPDADHVHPWELRDARHWPWPATPEAVDRLTARVAAHVSALPTPMDSAASTPFVPWLPAPARTGSARYTGRLTEQWRIHTALHRHRAPLVSQSGTGRTAQLRGMPGIGKSLLAQEYALRFGPAFPGGIFWFDLHSAQGGSPAEALDAYADQVLTVVSALGLDHSAPALPRLLSRLALALGERGAPCLWVVDGVPDGLAPDQLHLLHGPHLLTATLITTRSLRYAAFAEAIDIPPLPDTDGYRLVTSRRRPQGDAERAAALALVRDVDGHPEALDRIADLAAVDDFARVRNRLHRPGTGILPARGAAAGPDGLRGLLPTAREPVPAAPANPAAAPAAARGPAPAVPAAPAPVPVSVPMPVSMPVPMPMPVPVSPGSATAEHPPHHPAHSPHLAHQPSPGPGPFPGLAERAAAFVLQVELVTRVGVQPLAPDQGSLREALTSLYSLFATTRDVLHRIATETGTPLTLPHIASALANQHLRPFLTAWHAALQEHEGTRPEHVGRIEHERRWKRSAEMRADLAALRTPLTAVARQLAALCGTDLTTPPPA
jgi:TIR domain